MLELVKVYEVKHVAAGMKHVQKDTWRHEQQLVHVFLELRHVIALQILLIMSSTCYFLRCIIGGIERVKICTPFLWSRGWVAVSTI